ncbi:STM4012 family radical SAM protein [Streptomyces calidiresistens]|uniref:Heme chaperone HemW n=1 Tax=Streptomyces calidiresistens TaxID=1485586 RepID=A0A7W3T0U9_9ACTN|nr:STM4012 family radical SAM protein [Streptomyces calidiresistens]MBB0228850.1 coproporphyrinogen III oxidase family protein [Streptomyces calidiresistens]
MNTPSPPRSSHPVPLSPLRPAEEGGAEDGPYRQYVYAYPHKTAYRRLDPPVPLREVWAGEEVRALSFYVHVPFCGVRCGFCNLFTRVGAPDGLTAAYLDAVEREAGAVREALGGGARFATAAIGGGTPTFLTAGELERLFDIAESRMGVDTRAVPLSVETSPDTATADRLRVLAERGTDRVSIGVQSFVEEEARAAVRPQRREVVDAALDRVRALGFPVLNIDLIYGIPGQTAASWAYSLRTALGWRPEEVYLYPLYRRPLTGLARRDPAAAGREFDAHRMARYREGVELLTGEGYRQVSMRMFRRADAPADGAGDYSCQADGMVGLGCGARSYTSSLHYSFDYAVAAPRVRGLIDEYVAGSREDFATARHGRRMSPDESRRRFLLQSLLQAEGMDSAGYTARFGEPPERHFPVETGVLEARGWLAEGPSGPRLRLSAEGLAHSDAVGPLFFSPSVRASMEEYLPR